MKRMFSLLIAAACLFSSLTFAGVAHAEAPSSFTDVTNKTQYYEGIMTLTKLGIINGYANDDGTTFSFKPDGEITRAEFSKIIMVALGAGESLAASDKFTDIDEHWAKGYIIAAADRGIVNGMGDGTFAPDEKVTYEQAVKMIVCAAGYENAAQAMGGWPNGYILQAGNLGITKDAVTVNTSFPAARGIIAQLMYNVLEVEIPQYDINGNIKDNLDTFMETYLDIIKEKATIVGIEDKVLSTFNGQLYIDEIAVMLRDGTIVKMDYTTYTEDKSVFEERLGQEAVVYYRKGKAGNMNTLYEIDFESTKNTITVVNSKDIDDFSGSSLTYYDQNDRLKNVTINGSGVSVYYNGKLVDPANVASKLASVLDPAQTSTFMYGEVKLTDSGSDNSIDIVEIMDYDYLVVSKTPSTTDYLVSNKVKFTTTPPVHHLQEVYLDPDSVIYTVSITNASGAQVSPTSLKANDVLLVAQSDDTSVRTVKVCSSPVTGKITATSSADGTITINNKEYTISDYAKEYFGVANANIKTETGSQGTFYVDSYGEIVYGVQTATTQSTSPYVYIIRAVKNDDEESGTITAYVPSASAVRTYSVSGKIKYNGTTKGFSEAIDDLKNNIFEADNLTPLSTLPNVAVPDYEFGADKVYDNALPTLSNACQVARITLNGTEIEEIMVAEQETYGQTDDTMKILPYAPLAKRNHVSSSFGGDFYVNSSTTFIYVPADRTQTTLYAKKSQSSFKGGVSYWVQPYNVNSSKMAELVVVYGTETDTVNVKDDAQVWLLASDHSTSYIDDEQMYQVSYYANEESVTEKTASLTENLLSNAASGSVDISNVSMGDFFRTGTDSSSRLVNAQVLVDYDDVMTAIESGNCDFTGSDFRFSNSYIDIKTVNVIEVLEDNGKYSLRVTAQGFAGDDTLPTEQEKLVSINPSTVIYRVSGDGKITPYIEGSETERITVTDFGEAKYDGRNASKIGIYSYSATTTGTKTTRMILIYE